MQKYTVSYVCPTYRRPRLAELAVKLFLAQTWERSELIVIDDSPDSEQPSIRPNARVKYVRLKDKLTMGEKHNVGTALAQGDVLGYWDDDDFFSARRTVTQLEPIVLGEAEVTGMSRKLVARIPSCAFYVFADGWWKSAANRGNTVGNWALPWHDGTALYTRRLAGLAQHPPLNLNQKVQFLNAAIAAGKAKWKRVENDGHFVYVRHQGTSQAPNTWQFRESTVLEAIKTPYWFPQWVLDAWRAA